MSAWHWPGARWSDDAGNETTYLAVFEVDDDGQITHHIRFDGDDADAAYRELENRYYAGEGAAFAANGHALTEWLAAMDRLDLDAVRSLVQPEFRWLAAPSALISHDLDLSVDEFFRWQQERGRQVSSAQHRIKAMRWVSPNCCITHGDVRAIGLDGEDYEWTGLFVGEFRDGLLASVRQFELDDEDAAFAYADTLVTPQPSRLAVSNRASETLELARKAMRANDAHTTAGFYADLLTYDDRRRISGDSIHDRTGLLAAAERILAQYNRFDSRTLAVRGDHLALSWDRWTDDAGNETTNLRLIEVDDDERITYEGRFDEDDFEGAYRELEHRYYAGEGSPFALNGQAIVDFLEAMDRLDIDAARRVSLPECRWVAPPSTLTLEDRSIDETFRWLEQRARQVSLVKNSFSILRWLSPTCMIGRGEVRAIGPDGEEYEWSRIYVDEFRDGLLASVHQFDDDEDAAFAYAETLVAQRPSRLAVSNRASGLVDASWRALQAHDVDGGIALHSERLVYDDRRRLSGDPVEGIAGMRAACERILEQYPHVEWRTLAVRGERLEMCWGRWTDDAGNETTSLHVFELGDDGLITCHVRFDGDDFEGAYRELESRYYSGEGMAYAESGAAMTEVVTAQNRGDLDKVFGELCVPTLRIENRSRSAFPDRSAAELRASMEELDAMVGSSRTWYSAVSWLSRDWVVARHGARGRRVGR